MSEAPAAANSSTFYNPDAWPAKAAQPKTVTSYFNNNKPSQPGAPVSDIDKQIEELQKKKALALAAALPTAKETNMTQPKQQQEALVAELAKKILENQRKHTEELAKKASAEKEQQLKATLQANAMHKLAADLAAQNQRAAQEQAAQQKAQDLAAQQKAAQDLAAQQKAAQELAAQQKAAQELAAQQIYREDGLPSSKSGN